MERIGLAASKMAQGNLLKYNLFVVGISCLFAIFLFVISGFSVLAALFLISLILRSLLPPEFSSNWVQVVKMSLISLAVVIGILNVLAIIKNIKLGKRGL